MWNTGHMPFGVSKKSWRDGKTQGVRKECHPKIARKAHGRGVKSMWDNLGGGRGRRKDGGLVHQECLGFEINRH